MKWTVGGVAWSDMTDVFFFFFFQKNFDSWILRDAIHRYMVV